MDIKKRIEARCLELINARFVEKILSLGKDSCMLGMMGQFFTSAPENAEGHYLTLSEMLESSSGLNTI